jgi:uncharacterized protein (DUF1684 family)
MTHEHHHEPAPGHEHHHHDYATEVADYRARKDAYFRAAASSPIPPDARSEFTGLPYFAIDPELRLEGIRLEPYAGSESIAFEFPTSDGKLRPAHRAGSFTFDLGGAPRTLAAYTIDGGSGESLFVPFLDATSGRETYGAGRYLDLEPEGDGTYSLDFNMAYHPFCVFAPSYSCPLTPAENRLSIRIEAGERLPEAAPDAR